MNELVSSQNGKPVTNSLLVAEKFGKEHKNVLASIREILTTAENSAVLQMFSVSSYYNDQHKEQPMYIMDRDGFSLLVMGFNGKEAMKFKIDFLNAFNRMEEQLRNPLHGLTSLEVARRWYLAEQDRERLMLENEQQKKARELAEQKTKAYSMILEIQKPKVEFADRIQETPNLLSMSQTAKVLGLPYGRNILCRKLREAGIFFTSKNEPMQIYVDKGYFALKEKLINNNDGGFTVIVPYVSQKGLLFLSKVFNKSYPRQMKMTEIQSK